MYSHESDSHLTLEKVETHHTTHDFDNSLPFRTLSADAEVREFADEIPGGEIDVTGRLTPQGSRVDYKLVAFTPGDKENPKNWSTGFKWYCTMVVGFTCFVVAFNSSVVTADILGVAKEFRVSEEVAMLTISLFVVGFGIGPMVFAPVSEACGRRVVYGSTLLLAIIFIIPCAVAKNVGTLLACRAIDGIAFSAPMTIVGGTLADIWKVEQRGVAMAVFSAAPFLGPVIGPLAGGYLSDAAGWRWLYWLQLILSFVSWVLITFTVPETYAPTILSRRAASLRKTTGDRRFVTELEVSKRPLLERLSVFLVRPFKLLFTELIVFLIAVYMSVLYGVLYMFFVSFPVVFQEGKGYSAGSTGLMFIPIAVGCLLSVVVSPRVNQDYLRRCSKYEGRPPAELRLIPMMIGCWFIPMGLFIFAWTSYPRLIWVGPALGGFPVGFGFVLLYNSANNYLVDSYQHLAASALAAKTFLRSLYGAGVVLFTVQMYRKLGYQWAGSLIAFLSLACCVIPFLFYYKGAAIRAQAKYAYSGDDEEQQASDSSSAEK